MCSRDSKVQKGVTLETREEEEQGNSLPMEDSDWFMVFMDPEAPKPPPRKRKKRVTFTEPVEEEEKTKKAGAKKKATKKKEPKKEETFYKPWGVGPYWTGVQKCEECQRVWNENPHGWIGAGCRRCFRDVRFLDLKERNHYISLPRDNTPSFDF